MASLIRAHTFSDHWQRAYNVAQKVADIKICKDWTVFDIAKVVAVATSIFIGLHYIFGSSLLKGYSLAKWYRSVYEPFDQFTLMTGAITSICTFVYFLFQRFAPEKIDLSEAKRLGIREYVQHYRTILTSQPVDYWRRTQKYDLLEILHQKIEQNPHSLELIENSVPVQAELLKYWREKVGIPSDFQNLTTPELLALRAHVLTARIDIPWQEQTRKEICRALMRKVELKPQEVSLIDPTFMDLLKGVFLSDQDNLANKSIEDLVGIVQNLENANLPWQRALRQAALEAIAKKIEPKDVPLIPQDLRRNLIADPRNLPFIQKELEGNFQLAGLSLRECQHDQDRLREHAITIARQLHRQSQGQETALAQTLKWCFDLRQQTGSVLGDAFYQVMIETERDLYITIGPNGPTPAARDVLIDFLFYKYNQIPRTHYIDLDHIRKLLPSMDQNQPKIQKLMAMVLADHIFRLAKNEALAEPEIAPAAIPEIEQTLEDIIMESTVSFKELALHFADSLARHPGIDRRRAFTRDTTEDVRIGWGKWTQHATSRIRAVIHLFMYVISASDETAIPLSRERLMEAIAAMMDAKKADVLQGEDTSDLPFFFAELNTMPPIQNVSGREAGKNLQGVIQDSKLRGTLHPNYLPPPSPQAQPAETGGVFALFSAQAAPAPRKQSLATKEVRLPSLFV